MHEIGTRQGESLSSIVDLVFEQMHGCGNVHITDSYIRVELENFCFVSCLLRLLHAIRELFSVRYCGLVCCLRSSELIRTWEYHIVLIRNLQLCITVSELLLFQLWNSSANIAFCKNHYIM